MPPGRRWDGRHSHFGQWTWAPTRRGGPVPALFTGGSGVGLSLARQVALAHQGRVLAEDTGSGAVFSLVLPAECVLDGG